jgi:hypothetical protein
MPLVSSFHRASIARTPTTAEVRQCPKVLLTSQDRSAPSADNRQIRLHSAEVSDPWRRTSHRMGCHYPWSRGLGEGHRGTFRDDLAVLIVSPKVHRLADLHLRDNNRNGARTAVQVDEGWPPTRPLCRPSPQERNFAARPANRVPTHPVDVPEEIDSRADPTRPNMRSVSDPGTTIPMVGIPVIDASHGVVRTKDR